MSKYGERLINGYNPIKDAIYKLFTTYFQDPEMTKIKDVNQYSMYGIKVNAILGIEYRYIFAFVKKNNFPINDRKLLSSLEWDCIQTRTLEDEHNIPSYTYIPYRHEKLNTAINMTEKINNNYIYSSSEFPSLKIVLLSSKKDTKYNEYGLLINAIETYNTSISFI
jgi:hypothetical protein